MARKKKEPEPKTFIVRMECKVIRYVTCVCDTEDQARSDPFSYCTGEEDGELKDWDVLDVEESHLTPPPTPAREKDEATPPRSYDDRQH